MNEYGCGAILFIILSSFFGRRLFCCTAASLLFCCTAASLSFLPIQWWCLKNIGLIWNFMNENNIPWRQLSLLHPRCIHGASRMVANHSIWFRQWCRALVQTALKISKLRRKEQNVDKPTWGILPTRDVVLGLVCPLIRLRWLLLPVDSWPIFSCWISSSCPEISKSYFLFSKLYVKKLYLIFVPG